MSRTLKKLQFQQTPPGPFATTADLGDCNQYLYGLTNNTVLTKLQVKYFMTDHDPGTNYTQLPEYPDLYLLPNGPAGHAYNLTSAAFYYETNSDGTVSYYPQLSEVKDNNTDHWKYAGTFTLDGVIYDKWDKQVNQSGTWVSSGYYVLTTRVVNKICEAKVESAICDGTGANIVSEYCTALADVAYSRDVSDLVGAPSIYEYEIVLYENIGSSYDSFYRQAIWTGYSTNPDFDSGSGTYYSKSTLTSDLASFLYTMEADIVLYGYSYEATEPGPIDRMEPVIATNVTFDSEDLYIGYYPIYGSTSGDAAFVSIYVKRKRAIINYS